MTFTRQELNYIASQPVARLATVAADGQPDVVPAAVELDGTSLWVGGGGASFLTSRKVRNVAAGYRQVALVFDDVVSIDPFIARGIRVYGHASDPLERTGLIGPGYYLRITPTISWSWNLDAQPVGEEWYAVRRAQHHDA